MPARFISDLAGTLLSYFRIGTLRLKNNSTVLEVKDSGDTQYEEVAVDAVNFKGTTSGNIKLQPKAVAGTVTWTLPDTDGSTGDVLKTDGAGQLGWVTAGTGTNQLKSQTEALTYNSSSTVTIFTPPANAYIHKIIVDVETAFDASGPATMTVGVSGDAARYMGATENDLTTVAIFEVEPMYEEDGTPEQIEIAFSAGSGGAAGAANVSVIYSNPD